MIAIDTSALMAILLNEAHASVLSDCLAATPRIVICAGTLAEALIVAECRNLLDELNQIIDGLGVEVVGLTPQAAKRVAQAYAQWGKGLHPAGLNFGDCFAYVLAKDQQCPLLYVGEDFSKTDIVKAV